MEGKKSKETSKLYKEDRAENVRRDDEDVEMEDSHIGEGNSAAEDDASGKSKTQDSGNKNGDKKKNDDNDDDDDDNHKCEVLHRCFNCFEISRKKYARCSRCLTAMYCSKECQKKAWSKHKKDCKYVGKYDGDDLIPPPSKSASNSEENKEKKSGVISPFIISQTSKTYSRPLHEMVPCFNCKTHKEKLKKCPKCNIAKYCGRNCQTAHWPCHKVPCRLFTEKAPFIMKSSDRKARLSSLRFYNNVGFVTGGELAQKLNAPLCFCCGLAISAQRNALCPSCEVAIYCDENCKTKHLSEHKRSCANFKNFYKAMANTNELLSDIHDRHVTGVVHPQRPHSEGSDVSKDKDKNALLLEIVGPFEHFCRHGVYLKDIKGDLIHMVFYHHGDDEYYLLPNNLKTLLSTGNFIRWFYPRWRHFAMDGLYGYRVDGLDEIEFIKMV